MADIVSDELQEHELAPEKIVSEPSKSASTSDVSFMNINASAVTVSDIGTVIGHTAESDELHFACENIQDIASHVKDAVTVDIDTLNIEEVPKEEINSSKQYHWDSSNKDNERIMMPSVITESSVIMETRDTISLTVNNEHRDRNAYFNTSHKYSAEDGRDKSQTEMAEIPSIFMNTLVTSRGMVDPDQEQTGVVAMTPAKATDRYKEKQSGGDATSEHVPPTPSEQVGLSTWRTNKSPTEKSGMFQCPMSPQLPAIERGQVCAQQMSSAIEDAVRSETFPSPRQQIRSRRPTKYVRLATVPVSKVRTRSQPLGPSLHYEEPLRTKKVITWGEAINARPPLRIDMEGPTPCTYSPRIKPLQETNAPAFSFGSRCYPEKKGGSRTAWSKTWFQTPHVWHTKVDFIHDLLWPSPVHYHKPSSLGPRQRTMPEAPSFTFGHRTELSVKSDVPNDPSPNEYQRHLADKQTLPCSPAFTHQLRREGTVLWGVTEKTPGPACYNPAIPGRHPPAFTIQGIRREKSHLLGPYSSF